VVTQTIKEGDALIGANLFPHREIESDMTREVGRRGLAPIGRAGTIADDRSRIDASKKVTSKRHPQRVALIVVQWEVTAVRRRREMVRPLVTAS
jgi:hypothetical protein